jgi:hypothetical protein
LTIFGFSGRLKPLVLEPMVWADPAPVRGFLHLGGTGPSCLTVNCSVLVWLSPIARRRRAPTNPGGLIILIAQNRTSVPEHVPDHRERGDQHQAHDGADAVHSTTSYSNATPSGSFSANHFSAASCADEDLQVGDVADILAGINVDQHGFHLTHLSGRNRKLNSAFVRLPIGKPLRRRVVSYYDEPVD